MRRARRRLVFIVSGVLLAVALLLGGLFVINGVWLANGETPLQRMTGHPAAPTRTEGEIKILAYNIAKCFIYVEGKRVASREDVTRSLAAIVDVINSEHPDLVFLSEAVLECGPCPGNQVQTLAAATGMHAWVFGENYNFGLPFYRMIGGNAILSRGELQAVTNRPLAGRRPFYVTQNNRRVLFCTAEIGGREVLLGAMHTDSFSLANNLTQTREILDFMGDRPAILAGDFNARPEESSMQLVRNTGRFSGRFNGAFTFPADRPVQRIDFILAPATWELLEEHVVETTASDHRPVVSTFRVQW